MRLLLLIIGIVTWHVTLISTKDNDVDNSNFEARFPPSHRLARSTNYNVSGAKKLEAFKAVTRSINAFAAKYFKIVLKSGRNKTSTKSIVCAPLSASLPLSLAAYGAGGKTGKEIRSVLALPANNGLAKIGFRTLLDKFMDYGNINLELSIDHDQLTVVKHEFNDTAIKAFYAIIGGVVFDPAFRAQKTKDIFNSLESGLNYGTVRNVIWQDTTNETTSLVFASVLNINGQWLTPFNSGNTTERVFYIKGKSKKKNIPTMYGKQRLRYGVLPKFRAKFVGLPIGTSSSKEDLMMYIILPNKNGNLANVEKKIDKSFVEKLINGGKVSAVELYVPKFSITTTRMIDGPLKKMGLKNMFTKSATFDKIMEKKSHRNFKGPYKVAQAAAIYVHELGVGYGESTDFRHGNTDGLKMIKFQAHRPFLWTIVSKKLRVPIFMGRFTGHTG